MSENRFIRIYKQSGIHGSAEILQDTQTGIQYLFCRAGYGAGLTPLLDREGKPVAAPLSGRGEGK